MGTDRISLEEIAKKYGTLKVQHGYMPIYERFFELFRNQAVSLLEIGVHEGASLRTWREYFHDNKTSIFGLEKVPVWPGPYLSEPLGRSGVFCLKCDINDKETVDSSMMFCGQQNFIIDDASHIQSEVVNAFSYLWDYVKPGGYYVVEDLFAAYDPVWNPSGPVFIDLIQARMKNILIGGDEIQEVHFFGRNDINGILFLRKRYEPFRIQPLTEFQ